uniref:Uncharacterized protein n=1 Tax=Anopheles quadriannulatus TaxID=34691 RepID=A0A182XSI3_ANOQN
MRYTGRCCTTCCCCCCSWSATYTAAGSSSRRWLGRLTSVRGAGRRALSCWRRRSLALALVSSAAGSGTAVASS